mmetsp:Transcript_47335/g.75626  ORF Transcript_47335/g.75626 Transcript_47335/m.75626 type:complete len:401 (-) Transcript_47335:120-1322(-)
MVVHESKSSCCLSAGGLSESDTAYMSQRITSSASSSSLDEAGNIDSHTPSSKIIEGRSFSMDCQVCSISFEPNITGFPGMAHLTLVLQKARVVTQYHIKTVSQALESTLQRIERACTNFVISYDLRNARMPMPELAQTFAKLHREHAPQFARQLKAIAVLVADNLFTMAAKNGTRNFIRGSCFPSCPHFVGHSRANAEDFFRALPCRTHPKGMDSFVSLVSADEVSDEPECVETCIGKLVPLHRQDSNDDANIVVRPMMHQLSNGDVRVVQTAAIDVMLRQDPQSKIRSDGETSSKESLQSNRTVKAFKFQCSPVKLQEFIGAIFHIGELTIDADAASKILANTRKNKNAAGKKRCTDGGQGNSHLRSAAMFKDVNSTCLGGVAVLIELLKQRCCKDAKV